MTDQKPRREREPERQDSKQGPGDRSRPWPNDVSGSTGRVEQAGTALTRLPSDQRFDRGLGKIGFVLVLLGSLARFVGGLGLGDFARLGNLGKESDRVRSYRFGGGSRGHFRLEG